jgi:hypothetical protein
MSSFPILDLVAGMVFIYFLLSIMCSSAVEMILTGGKYRAKMLENWLMKIFKVYVAPAGAAAGAPAVKLGELIMDHHTVTALSGDKASTAYMAPANFTSALLDKVSFYANPNSVPTDIKDFITALKTTTCLDDDLQRVFLSYAYEAQATFAALPATNRVASEVDLFRAKIETWFDTNMERVGGQLKTSYTRPITFIVAALTALLLNADSVAIAKYLYNNPEARTKIAANAYEAAHNPQYKAWSDHLAQPKQETKKDSAATAETYQQINDSLAAQWKQISTARAALEDNSIPLGWNRNECRNSSSLFVFILTKSIGLFATFFAIIMGAPFWFDILNKISNLRGTGKKPATASKKSKK